MRMTAVALGLVLFVTLVATGCGRDIKKENEQLKAQVAALQKENLTLKGESTSLKADAEALKNQFGVLTREKQGLEERLKEIEARIAAKPGTRPPLKPKRTSTR
jgi:predicted nuclease with TOPRIM domain